MICLESQDEKFVESHALEKNKKVAQRGGKVAGVARKETEKELGHSIVSQENYLALEKAEKSKQIKNKNDTQETI